MPATTRRSCAFWKTRPVLPHLIGQCVGHPNFQTISSRFQERCEIKAIRPPCSTSDLLSVNLDCGDILHESQIEINLSILLCKCQRGAYPGYSSSYNKDIRPAFYLFDLQRFMINNSFNRGVNHCLCLVSGKGLILNDPSALFSNIGDLQKKGV